MEHYNATASLQQATYSPRRLMAIYAAVLALFILLCAAVQFGVNAVDVQSGLDSFSLQIFLSTVKMVLPVVGIVLLPIWISGIRLVSLGIARGQRISPRSLTEGFSRLLPLLISLLFMGLEYGLRAFISLNLATTLIAFTPVGNDLYHVASQIQDPAEADLAFLLGDRYPVVMGTLLAFFAVLFLVISLPAFDRYRMTGYLIVDRQESGGMRAMLRSRMLMYRRRWELAKLDLHFWWYYLLMLIALGLCLAPQLIALTDWTLPLAYEIQFWGFLIFGLGLFLTVQILAGPKIRVTYALRYEQYLQTPPPKRPVPQPQPQSTPTNLPWDY